MPELGECEKCHGPLCISSAGLHRDERTDAVTRVPGVVRCEKCGHAHSDHPTSVAMFEHFTAQQEQPVSAPVMSRMDNVGGFGDRLAALEKLVATQGEHIKRLERALAETMGQKRK